MKRIENNLADYVLVLGCQRSGTTILASCLGSHPDIAMLVESNGHEVKQITGKRYNGNKLCLYDQIRYKQRASKFGYFINKIVNNPFCAYKRYRPFPTSKMSIRDYENMGARIIYIIREKEPTIQSMMKRTGMSRRLASIKYDKAMIQIGNRGIIVYYESFVNDNEKVLREICKYLDIPFANEMLEGQKHNFIYSEYKRKSGVQQEQDKADD